MFFGDQLKDVSLEEEELHKLAKKENFYFPVRLLSPGRLYETRFALTISWLLGNSSVQVCSP